MKALVFALAGALLVGCQAPAPGHSDAELGYLLGLDARPPLPAAPETLAESAVRALFADGTINQLTMTPRDWAWVQETYHLPSGNYLPDDGVWEATVSGQLVPALYDGDPSAEPHASQMIVVLVGPSATIVQGQTTP